MNTQYLQDLTFTSIGLLSANVALNLIPKMNETVYTKTALTSIYVLTGAMLIIRGARGQ